MLFFSLFFFLACNEEPTNPVELKTEDLYTTYTTSNGLSGNSVTAIYESPDGELWVGSYNGVSRLNGSSFTSFTTAEDGIIEGPVIAISYDFAGDLWIGGPNGYSIYDGSGWYTDTSIPLSAYYQQPGGPFWIGSYGYGILILYQDGNFEQFYEENCNLCNYVTDILPNEKNNIWFSTFGGAYRYSNESFKLFQSNQGSTDFLSSGVTDDWGNVWFASLEVHDLVRIMNNQVYFQPLPALLNVGSTSLARLNNKIYISTVEGKLLYFDGTETNQVTGPVEDYYVNVVFADSQNNLWIGTEDNGLIKFTPKESL